MFGILNLTPDSFSDGGAYGSSREAIAAGLQMADEGADVVDVGGESTRPGSQPIPPEEQIQRTQRVISELARRFGSDGPGISIDTRSAQVARAAIDAGAVIVNDVSAMRDDSAMAGLVAERQAGAILMHMKGTPADMQMNPTYGDVVQEVHGFLAERINAATAAGISRSRVLIDPGLGFGKTMRHNLLLLHHLARFADLGVPLLVGPSRKRFIVEICRATEIGDRLAGTVASVTACILAGAECVRVHDVKACRQAADLAAAICHNHDNP